MNIQYYTMLNDNYSYTQNTPKLYVSGWDRFSLQLNYIDASPAAVNFLSGEAQIVTATFPAKASIASGDYILIGDTDGSQWAIAADLTGSDVEPTGAIWTAIPSAQKAQVDLSAATTAAEVAAAFEVAFDALVSVPFSTDDTAADGTMIITNTKFGVGSYAIYNEDESGAGSISVAATNVGVNSAVNVTSNVITITAHGFETGLKLQATTTGTLPAGLSLATDYYVIVVSENSIKLASSLAYALAGTAIDIANQGADGSTNTLTSTSISASAQLQKSNDGVNWVSEGSAVTLTTPGSSFITNTNCSYRYLRFALTVAGGVVGLEALLNGFKVN